MKASAMYDSYDYDSDVSTFGTMYILGLIIGCIFWITVIYCCIRNCRKVAERPQVVQIVQNEQQPQIHYIIQQDGTVPGGNPLPAVGADGRPIMYQQVQGQFVPVNSYQPPVVAAPQYTATKGQNIV